MSETAKTELLAAYALLVALDAEEEAQRRKAHGGTSLPTHTHDAYVQKSGDTMTGNLTMASTKSVDAYANSGRIKVKEYVSAGTLPLEQSEIGEIFIWHDTTAPGTFWLFYHGSDGNLHSIQLA